MNTSASSSQTVNARTLLLPYALSLLVAMALVQAAIALAGGGITLLAWGLTAVVAVGIAVWLWRTRRALSRVRFGGVIAHAIAFVTVTTSFDLHACIRAIVVGSGPDGLRAASDDLLATAWFGVTLVMSAVWGLMLLLHLIGAVLGRGWED